MGEHFHIPTWYYRHHDADFDLDVPEEGFGGWQRETLEFSPGHTGLVVMHAWDCGTYEQYPGWYRCVPYIPRAVAIAGTVFPRLLDCVRSSPLPVFHVVGGREDYKELPGFLRARELAGPASGPPEKAPSDPCLDALRAYKREHAYPGSHNEPDIERGHQHMGFMKEARPLASEGIAEDGRQLFALCKERNVNHLVYCGFAINWCLLLSPGGMHDMQQHGVMCSALRQATTAVENRETARQELCKETALWRVSLAFGFVFDVDDFVQAVERLGMEEK